MKEISSRLAFKASLIDQNGEFHDIEVDNVITERYYSIRKLNTKVMYMDLIIVQSKLCNSSKDILVFGELFGKLKESNRLELPNISKFCRNSGFSRTKVTNMLKKAEQIGFTIKLEQGLYFVNPFVIRGTGFKSNKSFEACQKEWEEMKNVTRL